MPDREPHHVPDRPVAALSPAWRRCVGTGRMALSLRGDLRDALGVVQEEVGFEHIRGHGLFHDDMGVHHRWEHGGRSGVVHAFTYVDQVVDTYLALGLRPVVELGFMPAALASGDQTVFWWRGNVTPPRDHREWADLVRATVAHLVDSYGLDEVRRWPIEVWNEPNLPQFWQDADRDAYVRLYEASAHAVKEVDASLQVGGPVLSPGADDWWAPFVDAVVRLDLPVDFVSSHAYSAGPAEHLPVGVHQPLGPPQVLLDQFAAPRRHLTGTPLEHLPVHITEFNTSYRPDNPVHDTAYNAAYLAPVLVAGGDHADSFAYWTVSDVFEEAGVPTTFLHGGFGLLAHRGVRKPTYHLYAFMARLGPHVLARGEDHLVTRHDDGRVAVLAWQPVDGSPVTATDGHRVRLSVPVGGAGGATRAYLSRRRVSEEHGNVWTAWRELGRPASPTRRQVDTLHEAARPVYEHAAVDVVAGRVGLDLTLARHEVTLVELEPVRDETPWWVDDSRIPGYGDLDRSGPGAPLG